MNWPSYNQSLVRRGEILLGFDVINNWDNKLKEMKDKMGEPFHYSTFSSAWMCQDIFSFVIQRQTYDIAQGHPKEKVHSIPDFTTINSRIIKLNILINNYKDKFSK